MATIHLNARQQRCTWGHDKAETKPPILDKHLLNSTSSLGYLHPGFCGSIWTMTESWIINEAMTLFYRSFIDW